MKPVGGRKPSKWGQALCLRRRDSGPDKPAAAQTSSTTSSQLCCGLSRCKQGLPFYWSQFGLSILTLKTEGILRNTTCRCYSVPVSEDKCCFFFFKEHYTNENSLLAEKLASWFMKKTKDTWTPLSTWLFLFLSSVGGFLALVPSHISQDLAS